MANSTWLPAIALLALSLSAGALAQPAETLTTPTAALENDGTDPTKLTTQADLNFEHFDLRGGAFSDTFQVSLTTPLGAARRVNVRVRVPVAATDVLGDKSYGFGDIQVKSNYVLAVTPRYGVVVSGEVQLPTADRVELGTGRTVLKATAIYARFLPGGAIFAPAIVHSFDVGGDDDRSGVSSTTADFYYVPKIANPKIFVTLDPAVTFDWENSREFASLAVTTGYRLGPMAGGTGQVFVKPTVFVGSERVANWGLQAGLQVLNF